MTDNHPTLCVARLCSDQLQLVVRDLERLYVEAARGLNVSGRALTAAAQCQGPEPSLLQLVEVMQDTWWVGGCCPYDIEYAHASIIWATWSGLR